MTTPNWERWASRDDPKESGSGPYSTTIKPGKLEFNTREEASRFELAATPSNYLLRLQQTSKDTRRLIKPKDLSWQQRRMGYHGVVKRGESFTLHVYFSDDGGDTFDAPLVSAPGNSIIQLKLEIAQLNAEPLLHGFRLRWRLPTGWVFTDGLTDTTWEEAISNPLIFTRTVRSPVGPQPAGFRAIVSRQYR